MGEGFKNGLYQRLKPITEGGNKMLAHILVRFQITFTIQVNY